MKNAFQRTMASGKFLFSLLAIGLLFFLSNPLLAQDGAAVDNAEILANIEADLGVDLPDLDTYNSDDSADLIEEAKESGNYSEEETLDYLHLVTKYQQRMPIEVAMGIAATDAQEMFGLSSSGLQELIDTAISIIDN